MIVALLIAAALQSEPATGTAAAAPAKTKVAAKTDPDRVCKLQPVLGSRMPVKLCYTRAELAERTALDKANLDKIQAQTPGPFSN